MTSENMAPARILSARLDALDARLKQAMCAMTSTEMDQMLRSRMQVQLKAGLRDCRDRLAAKREDIAAAATKESWSIVAKLEKECAPLLQEGLAFLQGARARAAGIDGGLCAAADLLLDEIERHCELGWRRFTILAESESFSEVVQLIRLRFPPAGIWNLAVAAHEYGHFATYRMTVAGPDGRRGPRIAEKLDARSRESRQSNMVRAHLQELFADCFATFVLGPSYPLSCVLLRFDLAYALNDASSHPAPAKRFAAMMTVLRQMNGETGSVGDFTAALDALDAFWLAALGQEDRDRAKAIADEAQVRDDAATFTRHLVQGVGGARYAGWSGARILAPALGGAGQALPAAFSMRDLLTAAWMQRLTPGASPEAVSREAMRLCRSSAQVLAS